MEVFKFYKYYSIYSKWTAIFWFHDVTTWPETSNLHLHASSDVVYSSGSYAIARVYSRDMTVRVVSKLARVTWSTPWARWWCGNPLREGKKGFMKDSCRGCKGVTETWEHVINCDRVIQRLSTESKEWWQGWRNKSS